LTFTTSAPRAANSVSVSLGAERTRPSSCITSSWSLDALAAGAATAAATSMAIVIVSRFMAQGGERRPGESTLRFLT
jgi:hypothetical protein